MSINTFDIEMISTVLLGWLGLCGLFASGLIIIAYLCWIFFPQQWIDSDVPWRWYAFVVVVSALVVYANWARWNGDTTGQSIALLIAVSLTVAPIAYATTEYQPMTAYGRTVTVVLALDTLMLAAAAYCSWQDLATLARCLWVTALVSGVLVTLPRFTQEGSPYSVVIWLRQLSSILLRKRPRTNGNA